VGGGEARAGGGRARAMFIQSFSFWFCFVVARSHFDRPINLFWGKHLGTPPKIKVIEVLPFNLAE